MNDDWTGDDVEITDTEQDDLPRGRHAHDCRPERWGNEDGLDRPHPGDVMTEVCEVCGKVWTYNSGGWDGYYSNGGHWRETWPSRLRFGRWWRRRNSAAAFWAIMIAYAAVFGAIGFVIGRWTA